MIQNPYADRDQHQKLITSRGSSLAHADHVWLTSVGVSVSCPAHRRNDRTNKNNSATATHGCTQFPRNVCLCHRHIVIFFIVAPYKYKHSYWLVYLLMSFLLTNIYGSSLGKTCANDADYWMHIWSAKYTLRLRKNAPNLPSWSFDKHGLILIIFGK